MEPHILRCLGQKFDVFEKYFLILLFFIILHCAHTLISSYIDLLTVPNTDQQALPLRVKKKKRNIILLKYS